MGHPTRSFGVHPSTLQMAAACLMFITDSPRSHAPYVRDGIPNLSAISCWLNPALLLSFLSMSFIIVALLRPLILSRHKEYYRISRIVTEILKLSVDIPIRLYIIDFSYKLNVTERRYVQDGVHR